MYSFVFTYEDGKIIEFTEITKVEYSTPTNHVTLSGDEILSCNLPVTRTLYLYSSDSSYSVSKNGLRNIEIHKER